MKSFLTRSISLVTVVLFVWSAAMAQTDQKKSPASGTPPATDDLTGVWFLKGGGDAGAKDHISSWVDKDNPTLTPLGAQLMASHKPSTGPRTVVPALENDPQAGGNPPGLVGTLSYGVYGMKFIKLPDSMFQVFEWYNHWRQIWTDGRKSPDWDTIGPYWYGYSVGNFKGDEFEIQTESLDNRAWLDGWGTPFSEAMKLVEHWRRVDHDTLALKLTINDPMTYTQSWTTKEIRFSQPKGTQRGELVEAAFPPIDEQEFIENLRDGGAGKNKK